MRVVFVTVLVLLCRLWPSMCHTLSLTHQSSGQYLHGTPSTNPCKVSKKRIDCSHLRLTDVPIFSKEMASNAEELDLSHNTLTKIPADAFNGFSNLIKLDLRYNSISKKSMTSELFYDLGKLKELCLGHNAINKLPDDLFLYTPHLEILDISYMNNGLRTIPEKVLDRLPNLKELCMDKNLISSAKITVKVIPHLQKLHLKRNLITNITQGDFDFLQGADLTLLDLSWNDLKVVDNTSFSPFKSLGSLNIIKGLSNPDTMIPILGKALKDVAISSLVLSLNNIKTMDSQTFQDWQMSSLIELDLSQNEISVLVDDPFSRFQYLTRMSLYKNHLTNLSSRAFAELRNLQILDLANNSLTEVTALTFESLANSNLHTLYLEQNQIRNIAVVGAFNRLANMKFLKLSKNLIEQTITGSEFDGMPNLEYLDLGLNKKITLLSGAFQNNLRLEKLYLNVDHINIIESPSPFRNLTALRTLDLSNNSMVRFGTDVFEDLNRLEILYLQHNNLMQVWDNIKPPINYLHGLTSLTQLDLSFNGFVHVPPETFQDQSKLKVLLMAHNRLSEFPQGLLDPLILLTKLELHSNVFTVINKTNFEQVLDTLKVLSISDNPFSCTCDLEWFRNWLNSTDTDVMDLNDIKCFSPPEFANKALLSYLPPYLCDHILPLYAVYLISGSSALVLLVVLLLYYLWSHIHYMCLIAKTRRHRRRHVQYRRNGYQQLDGADNDFEFDAFISFSSKDQAFVDDILKPQFEGNNNEDMNLRLCFHNEQFIPGDNIFDNISKSMENSRKTICLLSENFLASSWCKLEKDMAICEQLWGGNNILIIVCLEKIPSNELSKYDRIYKMMKKDTYLEWSEDMSNISKKIFWERLRVAINQDIEEEQCCCSLLFYCCCCCCKPTTAVDQRATGVVHEEAACNHLEQNIEEI